MAFLVGAPECQVTACFLLRFIQHSVEGEEGKEGEAAAEAVPLFLFSTFGLS